MAISPAQNISSYIIQSQEEEIKRIAFELHEGVGQTLYSLYTGLQFLESGVEQPAAKSYLRDMALVLEKTIQEVRLLSVELHPPTLTTLGLLPAIKSYIKLYTSTFGIEVKLENKGAEKPIAEHNSIALFRVCQEALGNIAKYADTSNARLSFIWEPVSLKIEISDAGKGFDVKKAINQSSGLAAMHERMILAGGQCHISSAIGKGTTIRISLPLT
ncbi:two-component sensor histidine kinase [Bacillus canaveralius]|uniref:histidine kinase n=1 Tax=Bacillus canaveralius TaxID=1403243 RepID=A0A2N5GSY0_9BACI|nr:MULTISPECIES: sensor histidine kinase [Bacillus]PLR83614.1 two-component sensor histidine kinase [Bacillus sp. V33-4]PLR86873.1 two-component sensor histidine kinase [Bacillus canaveralius]PLR93361.1 two-component sensor histidine kinase [Bacillus canaveralius]